MNRLGSRLFTLCVLVGLANAQYYNGLGYAVPTEIIDLGPDDDFPIPYNSPQGSLTYAYPYAPHTRYPSAYYRPRNSGQNNAMKIDTETNKQPKGPVYPKYMFQNPSRQYPLGYFVMPAGKMEPGAPQYKITETSHQFYTSNVEPKRTFSSTSELKPLTTVVNRYFDKKSGKSVVEVETNGKVQKVDASEGNVIDKKFEMNVSNNSSDMREVAPRVIEATEATEATQPETTTPPPITTTTPNPDPDDVLSWFS